MLTRRGLFTGVAMSGFNNSVLGGASTLIRKAIRSPNFVTGSSGWSINKDGSAEFNNVVIRGGQVISGTALYYNGAAAAGNLIASISASAGTDSHGNAYLQGFTSYDPAAFTAVQMQGGITDYWQAASQAGPYTSQGYVAASGGSLTLFGGTNPLTQASLILQGGSSPLITLAGGDPWHSLGNIGGGTGMTINAGRYRLTPEGEVEIDVQLTCNSGPTVDQSPSWTNTLGASYLPSIARVMPLACSSDQNTGHRSPRVQVSTGGTVTIFIPPMATSGVYGGTVFMPVN